jgi:hypothetical protein
LDVGATIRRKATGYKLEVVDENHPYYIDRDSHVMSLCSSVWTIVETKRGIPTCQKCHKQWLLMNDTGGKGDVRSRHRQRQQEAVLVLP